MRGRNWPQNTQCIKEGKPRVQEPLARNQIAVCIGRSGVSTTPVSRVISSMRLHQTYFFLVHSLSLTSSDVNFLQLSFLVHSAAQMCRLLPSYSSFTISHLLSTWNSVYSKMHLSPTEEPQVYLVMLSIPSSPI